MRSGSWVHIQAVETRPSLRDECGADAQQWGWRALYRIAGVAAFAVVALIPIQVALGPTTSTAGILVPGFLGHDAFNLVVGVPILLGGVWFARRGSLLAMLLWPGGLFYLLYTYAIYLIGAPFSGLFLLYALLVALCGSAPSASSRPWTTGRCSSGSSGRFRRGCWGLY